MSRTTPDPETPIFGELNKELGELPEFDVHDFDAHAFGLLTESGDSDTATEVEPDSAPADSAKQDTTKQPPRIKAGGRRRKEN